MKRLETLLVWSLVLCIILLFLTLGDFLSLHNIKQDYVSTDILADLQVKLSKELPEWTSTKAEWFVANVSFFLKSVFTIFAIITLSKSVRKLKSVSKEQPDSSL
ncbi:MAG: hypothetical protein IMY71_05505 [Bacteroidetes bacterium]|nr:hypothetical protein [Bacteroidota bacterium]